MLETTFSAEDFHLIVCIMLVCVNILTLVVPFSVPEDIHHWGVPYSVCEVTLSLAKEECLIRFKGKHRFDSS